MSGKMGKKIRQIARREANERFIAMIRQIGQMPFKKRLWFAIRILKGQKMHELEELEQLVLTALAPLTSQGVKTLELYAGQGEAEDIEELAKLTKLFPSVYVVATGLSLQE
jgi:galactose-1-phosphate uridylyltransferase